MTWRTLTAVYLPHEREFMRRLKLSGSERECFFVHAAKSLFDGRLR